MSYRNYCNYQFLHVNIQVVISESFSIYNYLRLNNTEVPECLTSTKVCHLK